MQLLKGKTAIVTGATRGIGKGVALKLAEQGANIAFTYISSSQKALALENELQAFGVKAKGYKSDASLMKDAEELIKDVIENFEPRCRLVSVRAIPNFDRNAYEISIEFYVVNAPTELVELDVLLERIR